MIATWMLSAVLFTALIGAAAYCAESVLRNTRKATRWSWLVALGASVAWPVLAPLLRRSIPDSRAMRIVAATVPSIQVVPDSLPSMLSWSQRLDVMLLTLWFVASAILVVRLVRAFAMLARIRRASETRVVDGVAVLINPSIGPAVIGLVQPSVLLPAALLDLEAPLRRLVIRHEEEHRRSGDPWIVLGATLALALMPWNLPLWWIARRARLALEVDCDARVLTADVSANQYGKLLLLVSQRQTLPLAPMLAASSSHLEKRISAMLPVRSHLRRSRIVVALVATVVAGIAACTSRIGDGIAGPKPVMATKSPDGDAAKPFKEFTLDKYAQQIPGSARVLYPDELRAAKVEGQVIAQFVVEPDGQLMAGSFKVLKSDNTLFTQAVQKVLPDLRYTPAEVKGVKVRQLVQESFTFALSSTPSTSSTTLNPDTPHTETRITEAHQIPGIGNLRYPDSLRHGNVQGEVVAQFVVDENGLVVPGSFKVVRSTHQQFTDAVKTALPNMRFYPAETGGVKVKQLITQPFTFSLSKD
ncbi:MAG: M56 family metallopeptidase [Gemmatimonadaceae bacterium]